MENLCSIYRLIVLSPVPCLSRSIKRPGLPRMGLVTNGTRFSQRKFPIENKWKTPCTSCSIHAKNSHRATQSFSCRKSTKEKTEISIEDRPGSLDTKGWRFQSGVLMKTIQFGKGKTYRRAMFTYIGIFHSTDFCRRQNRTVPDNETLISGYCS